MSVLVQEVESDAIISADGLYRYKLTRVWAHKPRMIFIMLNPSTADALKNDNTIVRCMGFARREGFGGITVLNLWAYRTKSPQVLWAACKDGIDIVGPHNDAHLAPVVMRAPYLTTVVAWGPNAAKGMERVEWLRSIRGADHLHHLGLSKDGHPLHPLRLRKDTPLTRWAA